MKSLRTGSVVLGLALITFAAGTAAAEDDANKIVTFGFTTDYYSKYIWRGQNVDNSSVLQPAFSASAYGFTGSIWSNLDMTNKSKTAPDNAGEFSEYDLTLDYTNTIPGTDWLSGSVGTIYYQFPNTQLHPTTEIYTGFSLPKVPLTPSFKWFRDVQAIHGSYFQYSIGQTFDKIYTFSGNCSCGLALGASYGWANAAYDRGYFGVNSGQSNDLTLTMGFPISVATWTIKPSINYSTMLGNSIREATNKSDNLWAGVEASISF